ncbi:MAG: hypothetical protein IIZ64_06645 [Erysipelotrichaceae bacterium]|nr:hypothetical protein [Erysipelotrichaceae bacterium]MBQ5805117.1 hypothetical protein [Erysipelotrichaceae bacterium]
MNLEMKTNYKRLFTTLLGVVLLGGGIGLATAAEIGSDCMASFCEVLSEKLGFITIGQLTSVIELSMLIYAFFTARKTVGIGSFLAMLLIEFPIDLAYESVPRTDHYVIKIIYVLIGIVLISFGAELIVHAELGMGSYEAFMYSFVYRYGWKFTYVKYVCDSLFLLMTILLHGHVGLGTILTYLLIPKCMEAAAMLIHKIRFD